MKNELFDKKKEELEAKYGDRIAGLAAANSVDLGVGFDMLLSNVESHTGYAGGGKCTTEEWAELCKDVADLRALGRR